jgi:hypothetical protein
LSKNRHVGGKKDRSKDAYLHDEWMTP